MNMLDDIKKRLQNLEEKFSYEERTVDILNDVIVEQQAQLNCMEEQIRRLEALLGTIQNGEEKL